MRAATYLDHVSSVTVDTTGRANDLPQPDMEPALTAGAYHEDSTRNIRMLRVDRGATSSEQRLKP